jgi:hypothetical protein
MGNPIRLLSYLLQSEAQHPGCFDGFGRTPAGGCAAAQSAVLKLDPKRVISHGEDLLSGSSFC